MSDPVIHPSADTKKCYALTRSSSGGQVILGSQREALVEVDEQLMVAVLLLDGRVGVRGIMEGIGF